MQVNSGLHHFEDISKLISNNIIQSSDIINIFAKGVESKTVDKKDYYRKLLFEKLKGVYYCSLQYGIKQIHFHSKENISFLRMHRPDKYGDDLTDIRETVARANLLKKTISGFEEGRIFNGFRHVYPLSLMGKNIGTVEVSLFANAFIDYMNKMYKGNYRFILLKKVVLSLLCGSCTCYFYDHLRSPAQLFTHRTGMGVYQGG